MQKLTPCLWFNFNADEAVEHYLAIFKNGEVLEITHYGDAVPSLKGKVLTMRFVIEGQEFAFPANPDQGYIDGSVYMDSAHHPVDVTSIRFDHATDTQPQVTISGVLNLEYEGLRDSDA